MSLAGVGTDWSSRAADAAMSREPRVADRWRYEWATLLKGFVQVWRRSGDPRYLEHVRVNVDGLLTDGDIATYSAVDHNIDNIAPGPLLLTLYRETGDPRYRRAADLLRGQLRTHSRNASGGFWHKRFYAGQMWLDGIYMACPFYAEYATLFDDPSGLDDVARQITLIADGTRDPRTGLFVHAWNEDRGERWADPRSGRSATAWGRGMGWFAMALVDVLDHVPAGSPHRRAIAAILEEVAAGIVRTQDPATGVWWQVLDQGERAGNYLESSASCMFVYALAKGARQGHLEPRYLAAARHGGAGIIDRFVTTTAGQVTLRDTCDHVGLGLARGSEPPYRDGSFEYYAGVPTLTDDHRGLGPFLMASVELETSAGR